MDIQDIEDIFFIHPGFSTMPYDEIMECCKVCYEDGCLNEEQFKIMELYCIIGELIK